MLNPLNLIYLLIEYWFVILWLAAIGVAYGLFGWRVALAVGTLGMVGAAYKVGGKTERDNLNKYADVIEEKREQAYENIKNRNTNRNTVIDRLRKRNY